ncbi:transporter [Methylococcus mesophilus]|uniref:transporter n=1 Tax=Methylococcus mesophilus TaxID=2993564 RepID=UPI00224AECA1|nr:transporter [Methylococcus mesophilus]UZR28499.1 transporter [Methylococcus mesophilus]
MRLDGCYSKRSCRLREFGPEGLMAGAAVALLAAVMVYGLEAHADQSSAESAPGRPGERAATYREHVHSTERDRPPPSPAASPAPGATVPEPSAPTIREPGPDLSNLPNSSYTLPEGGIYLEMSPFTLQGASSNSVKQYNWEFLFRYGLTDDVELRLFTQGLTVQGPPQSATGFSPLTFDTKVHLYKDDFENFNYSVGLEAYVQTTWGSPDFNDGTQGSLMVNVDHVLPWDIAFNWNFGFASLQDFKGAEVILPSFQWALQRDVVDDFALFIQGYVNAAALPRTQHAGAVGPVQTLEEHALGAGFQWTVNDRIAIFGSYTGALGDYAPSYLGAMGLAIAF